MHLAASRLPLCRDRIADLGLFVRRTQGLFKAGYGRVPLFSTPSTSASVAMNPPHIDFDAMDPQVQGVNDQWEPTYGLSIGPIPRHTNEAS